MIKAKTEGHILTTLRQQIGQMLIMGFNGTSIDKKSDIADWLSRDGLGGVILFDYDLINKRQGKNLESQDQIKQLIQQLKYFASNFDLTPFIALDYEGGAVDRLRHIPGCLTTKKPVELANLSSEELELELDKMASTLQSLGFNLNFAPVIDLNLCEEKGIIGSLGRSFSGKPDLVASLAKKFVQVFNARGISCCYKHFPGHGSALGDSHYGFVDVTETFVGEELEPYSILLKESELSALIMTAHVINRNLDENGLPATLSHPILNGLLREKLGFSGVIVSDDLQMQAISSHFALEDALRLTINAGADMIIFGNQLGQITAPEVIDCVEELVYAGAIEKKRIEQAYTRIKKLKQETLAVA